MEFTGVKLVGGAELFRSSGEGRGRSGVEGHGRSTRWRRLRRARGTVDREEDRLPRLGAMEIPADGAKARWRGRRGGEHDHRGSVLECGRGATVR